MQGILQTNSRARFISINFSLVKITGWGLFCGVIATMIMDIILIAIFIAAGIAPFTCFSIIGDTIINLFSIPLPGGSLPLGVAAHYLIGPLLGAFFGAACNTMPALRIDTRKKAILYAILYAEIVSLPLIALPPLFLSMTTSAISIWFGGAFGMHCLWGFVFGAIWRCLRGYPATFFQI